MDAQCSICLWFWCRDSAVLICVQPGDHRQAVGEALIARRSLDAGMCAIALRSCAFLDCDSDVEKLAKPCPIGAQTCQVVRCRTCLLLCNPSVKIVWCWLCTFCGPLKCFSAKVCRRNAKLGPDVHFLNVWIAQGASAQYVLMTCSLLTPNPFSLLLEKAGMIPIVDGPACSFCERRRSWTLKPQSSCRFARLVRVSFQLARSSARELSLPR